MFSFSLIFIKFSVSFTVSNYYFKEGICQRQGFEMTAQVLEQNA